MGPYERAMEWSAYVADWRSRGHWNYRQEAFSGCGQVRFIIFYSD